MTPRGRWALLVAVVAIAASGCRLQLDVDVVMQEDGSGDVTVTIELDRDATARVGGDVRPLLELDRLTADGWTVAAPVDTADGGSRVVLRQDFDTPRDGAEVLTELSGASGPFRDVRLERASSFWEDRWSIDGTVDFSRGSGTAVAGGFDDEAVRELAEQLGESIDRLAQVRVRVRLPGDVRSNATTKADNGAVWVVGLGGGAIDIAAEGSKRHAATVVLLAVAVLLTVVGLVVLLIRLAVRRDDARARVPSASGRAAPSARRPRGR